MQRLRNIGLICSLTLLLLTAQRGAAQFVDFVELTAEIEINDWDYWFFEDQRGLSTVSGEPPRSIFSKPVEVRCVVGTNNWLMESETGFSRNAKVTHWFTSTNMIRHSVITGQDGDAAVKRRSEVSGIAMISPPVGDRWTLIQDSADGNPGRPVRVADLMELRGRICWLAFCSSPCLHHDGRKLFPPSDIWKEIGPAPFRDETTVFDDGLGLPKSVEIFSERNGVAFQYQVRQTTNVFGWNFPLEFYLVQYRPARRPHTNSWEVLLTAKGRITSIGLGAKPEIPHEVWQALRTSDLY